MEVSDDLEKKIRVDNQIRQVNSQSMYSQSKLKLGKGREWGR